MSLTLWPRQVAARAAVLDALERGVGRQLVALPTGVGKSVLAANLAGEFARTLFLVHREELLAQAVATFLRARPGADVSWIGRGRRCPATSARFVVAMVQTASTLRFREDAFDLIVVDECHHAKSESWSALIQKFSPRLLLGLSATPFRQDGRALVPDPFHALTYEMTTVEAIMEGVLARPRVVQVATAADLSGVKVVAGEFAENSLARRVNLRDRNDLVVEAFKREAGDRRALLFSAGVDHAREMARLFTAAGIRADWVSGEDLEREKKIRAFKAGHLQVLANSHLLTEGYDDPGVSAVIVARPVRSVGLYAQMIGRGLRQHPGKADCLLLECLDREGGDVRSAAPLVAALAEAETSRLVEVPA